MIKSDSDNKKKELQLLLFPLMYIAQRAHITFTLPTLNTHLSKLYSLNISDNLMLKGLSREKVLMHQTLKQLTCIASLACIAAWSCRRRTLYKYHHGGISSHRRLHLEHPGLPGANQCRW